MLDNVVHAGNLLNMQNGSSAVMVDSQLPTAYLNNWSSGEADSMTIEPWQSLIDTSQRFELAEAQNYPPEDMSHEIENIDNTESPPPRGREQASTIFHAPGTSSLPFSVPGSSDSLTSHTTEYTRSKATKKQGTKAALKEHRTTKRTATCKSNDKDAVSKRKKHLQRNKVAATKCRQKKRVWAKDLEAQKKELERKHKNTHESKKALMDEVTQLKLQLMAHAGCGDSRIDGWIETEAGRFVQKTTYAEQGSTSVP